MTTLARRYRLGDVIGRGGMSTVYRATDRVLQRTVAVKVMSAALGESDPSYIARFEREARAAASLNNPRIVTVYDTGVDGNTHFIAMEYVDGDSLATVIANQAPLDPDRASRIAAEVADALETAHGAGLVHRDVKPANVMITGDGAVKVLDFGIARAADAATITQTASLVGTAAYMAPEHALGQPVDARSDIYSLGCVLYAMLTGAPPFTGDVAAAVMHQQVNAIPRPPSESAPGVSPVLDELVLQMLAKSPGDRPQTAAEVRDRLRGAPAPRRRPRAVPVPVVAPDPTDATRAMGAPIRRREPAGPPPPIGPPWVRYAVIVVVIAVVALVAALALAGGGGSGTSSSTGSSTPSRTSSTPKSPSSSSSSTSTTTPPKTTTTTVTQTATATQTTNTATTTTTTPATTTSTATPPGQGGTTPGKGGDKPGNGG